MYTYTHTHVSDTGRLIIQNSSHDVTENTSIYTDYRNKPTVKRTNIEIGGNIFVLAYSPLLGSLQFGWAQFRFGNVRSGRPAQRVDIGRHLFN